MKLKIFFQKFTFLNQRYTEIKWRERHVSLGKENPDKIFYVVRRATCKVGLFSYVMTNLGQIRYALEHGYIPVIDMQNNNNTYLKEDEVGKKNIWEYYFEQPCGYGLADIRKSKNIILSNGLIKNKIDFPTAQIAYDDNRLAFWKKVADQHLNVLNEIVKEVEERKGRMFGDCRVLGVLARGTDYVKSKPYKHPIQPEVNQLIAKSKEVMGAYLCERIYLVTEDQKIFKEFEVAFGEKLVAMNVERYQAKMGENINDIILSNHERDMYLEGKEYLESVLLLAKCNCLVAGNTSGTQGALLFSSGYEYRYVFDLGVWNYERG